MKLRMPMLWILLCPLMIPVGLRAQEQAKKPNDVTMTHLRVDVVLTEYNGNKKVSSLPYTLYTISRPAPRSGKSSLRMGVKVPVAYSSGSYQYVDVGTNIDCTATTVGDGSYSLSMNVGRTSIYAASQDSAQNEQIHTSTGEPVLRNFGTDFYVALRDGETKEGTSATDPLNGHVLKISVTLHVEK